MPDQAVSRRYMDLLLHQATLVAYLGQPILILVPQSNIDRLDAAKRAIMLSCHLLAVQFGYQMTSLYDFKTAIFIISVFQIDGIAEIQILWSRGEHRAVAMNGLFRT